MKVKKKQTTCKNRKFKQKGWNSKKNSKENTRNRSTVTKIKDTFDGLIRKDTAEKRINELEGMSIEILQTEMQSDF